MKSILLMAVLVLTGNAFALELNKMEDTSVVAPLVQDLVRVVSADEVVTARLLTVYRGGAAGASSVVITVYDQIETQGDISNSITYDLSYIVNSPKNVELFKVTDRMYILKFVVEEITLNADDEWEYTERTAEIMVNLTDSKAVHSMRLVKDVAADEI